MHIVAKDTWMILDTWEEDDDAYMAEVKFTVKGREVTENVAFMYTMTEDDIERTLNTRLRQLIKPKLNHVNIRGMKKIEY